MDENKKEELLAAEDTILRDVGGVLEAMETITEYEVFKVSRGGKLLFSFRIRGLDDEERENCRDQASKKVKNRRLGGMMVPGEFNSAKFGALLVYKATHPEDREWLWDNKDLRKKADALAGWQVVDKVLKSGEKENVIELIEKLSGFDEENAEETLKNL